MQPLIVGIEMVMRDRESFDTWWPDHLRSVYELVDSLYLRADPGTYEQVLEVFEQTFNGDPPKPTTIDKQFEHYGRFQEDAERQEMLKWAVDSGGSWAACFDADEVIEPGGGAALRSMLQGGRSHRSFRLVRVMLTYSSHHRPGYVLPRCGINPWRMFRLDSNSRRYRYRSDADGLHCGSVAAPGVGSITVPDLRVIHYHATTCQEYMAERAFYDQTAEVRKHGGIDWLYRCDRFGDERFAVPLEHELTGAAERLARISHSKGVIR